MFEYTESAVLVAVDHSRMKLLMPAWRKAQDQARNGERDSAERRLATLRQLDLTREEQSTVEFMIGAVRAACHDRVHVFALSEPDGIYYLPAELFVPGAPSWKPIEADYKRTRSRRPDGSYEDIKAWLRREKRADTSPKAFEKAAASAGDALPDEIARLYSAALEMASETYPRRSRWEADSP
jgi:hypothetical protein